MHHMINRIPTNELDKTEVNGTKAIDTIAASYSVIEYVEGCKLLEYNEIVVSDYRVCIIDVNLEDYFNEQLSQWDEINRIMINLVRRSYREKFVDIIEE